MKLKTAKEIGNRIKKLRSDIDLSQEKLSYKCNLHRTYIGAIERGEKSPTIETLIKITAALDISLSEFLKDFEKEI